MEKVLLKLLFKVWTNISGNLHSSEKCMNTDGQIRELERVYFSLHIESSNCLLHFSVFSTMPSKPGINNKTVISILNLLLRKISHIHKSRE